MKTRNAALANSLLTTKLPDPRICRLQLPRPRAGKDYIIAEDCGGVFAPSRPQEMVEAGREEEEVEEGAEKGGKGEEKGEEKDGEFVRIGKTLLAQEKEGGLEKNGNC